jgi:hypothetical protein
VRFIRFARKVLVVLVVGAAVTSSAAAPARAVGTAPQIAPLFNGSVYAIAYRGSTVYVGGSFTSVSSAGHTYQRQRLAAFDARTGAILGWAPSANATVRALVVDGGSLYAAGDFGAISGLRRDSLARLDAATGSVGRFAHSVAGTVYQLAVGNGRLYLGGSFTAIDASRRAGLAAFALAGGSLDARWRPGADDAVHALTVSGTRVYVGGAFHRINGVGGTLRIAALSASTGSVDRGFLPQAPAQVNAIAVDAAGVYAATGGQGGRAIAWTTGGAPRWQRVFDGDATAIATLNGVTYVGGHFDRACLTADNGVHGTCTGGSVARVKLAAVTGSGALAGWAPQANGVIGVRVLAVDRTRGAVGAGGDFTVVDGKNRKRYASFA